MKREIVSVHAVFRVGARRGATTNIARRSVVTRDNARIAEQRCRIAHLDARFFLDYFFH